MFRAQATTPYDTAIAKATDENLTSEDWGAIMEVCDKVTSDANGAKEAVQGLIRRLAHRNANVQLYTLELANALSQNCGKPMHRELASRAFTDALLKLANDRNTHPQVKARILVRTKEWSDMFKDDADLGIMYDAYYRLKQTNPQLQPPSAPQKNSLTDLDRQKEEEELQMALKLSLQEEERKKSISAGVGSSAQGAAAGQAAAASGGAGAAGSPGPSGGQRQQQQQQQQQQGAGAAAAPIQPAPTGTTAATVSRVRALYDFVPSEGDELEFKKGDVIAVLESVYKDWWRGSLKGRTGIFPLNYVEKLADPTPDELQREAQMEAEVFSEIKNVEKLLALLSTASKDEDSEEIAKLYQQTSAIRPKLIKLIEKYSQKKDDFTQLNEKFIKARRDYEALLETSMSHPPPPTWNQYSVPRPQIPQVYGGGPPGGYPMHHQPQGPPQQQQQDPTRFYTPGPVQDQQFPPSSPSPNFQRPGATPGPHPAPFYMAGAEVPPQGGPPSTLPQQQSQQQQPQSQQPPQQQQFPPRDHVQSPQQQPQQQQGPRIPSAGKQPAPIQTQQHPSSPPPQQQQHQQQQQYQAYSQPQQHGSNNPQELSTSVYDSPIAPHNPASATYTASVYSPDEAYAPAGPLGRPGTGSPSATPAPLAVGGGQHQQQQQPYQYMTYSTQQIPGQPQQQQPNPYIGSGYEDGESTVLPPPQQQQPMGGGPPPLPSGGAPPIPGSAAQQQRVYSPILGPQGSDSRFSLPSRIAGGQAPPSAPGGGGGEQPQYKAYVPPSAAGGGPGPSAPSAPGDYYRQAGGVSY